MNLKKSEEIHERKKYSSKTFVTDWFFTNESYPHDNDTKGNEALSTYNRFSTYDQPTPKSVSREDQEKTLSIKRITPSVYKHLINIITMDSVREEHRIKALEKAGLRTDTAISYNTDYRSTSYCDYTYPYPRKPVIVPKEEYYKVETKHRKLRTDPTDWRREGINKFFDDNLHYLSNMRRINAKPPPFALDYDIKWIWDISKPHE